MAAPIITVENLAKRYILRHQQAPRYTALRDVLADKARSLFRSSSPQFTREEFLALDDVSFTINPGDRVGIIGHNGAGKSTLLKVLSRIVEPSKGRIVINGRVASLLEVGTGFHPELTGRENIFLNGSILGMSRREITSKFDEIVAFAEVERFLDTPVKRYSSGMYVRLAFAVAAHLEPEVLIVDEVLAVGDSDFQRKSIGKMREISTGEGRTILFVSHNMGAIRTFCDRCILLDRGKVQMDGLTEAVLPKYFGLGKKAEHQGLKVTATPLDPSGEWVVGSSVAIEITWEPGRYAPGWHADIACYTMEGQKIFALQSHTMRGFSSAQGTSRGVRFEVVNPGLVDHDVRLDVGLKPSAYVPYDALIENALQLSPGNKGIEENRLADVILVPKAVCNALHA
ncbi:MAG: ABC transporter ATP-binding protein [Bacteroidetes bacterium]|nr:ABC transporter ATP-binding protein [Bacteroidota bacterium]MBS1944372.1 ABC transporter ATP-binding protein [Bacteroidota bacterium]